jgi:putative ABC transport system permease protein
LGFDIAGQVVQARITSVRKLDWASMRVNFFVVFAQGQMPDVPLSYISAFRAPPDPSFDNRLVRQFPNITQVDLTQTLAQVQRVLGQVIAAVEFLFVFTLAAGLVVLMTAITATRGEREREFAILRAVGASSALLRQVQRIELLGVGLLAGFLASVVAVAVGWALARWVFEFAWTPQIWVPLAGSVGGAVLALLAGWWGLRGVLNTPVMTTLRRATQN